MKNFKLDDIIPKIDITHGINQQLRKQQEEMQKSIDAIAKARREAIEREEKSIELQETLVNQHKKALELQKVEIEFLKAMNEDSKKIVQLIQNLETINKFNGKIIEANLLEIEKRLGDIINNSKPENLMEAIVNETKNQIVTNGISHGIQFLIMAIKTMITLGA